MRNRRAVVSVALISGVGLLGACADAGPIDPPSPEESKPSLFGGPPPDPASFDGGLDARFVAIAGQIPGFGGFYYDESGALNVVMAPTDEPMSPAAVWAQLSPHLDAMRLDPADGEIVVREGRYDFIQLAAMHRRVIPVLGLDGVVFTDADEVRNRIVVGVETEAAGAAVAQAVAMLGLPRGAVVIERAGAIELDQSLRDRIRPIPGGVQIAFDRFGSTFICTHGFNVRAPARPGVQGFVANSHCSRQRSEMLSTPYWQPSRVPENFVGEEVHDLPFHTGGDCPAGRVCRYSDALGVQYDLGGELVPADIDFGRIARTLFPGTTNPGSLDIDPANPRWEIVDENITVVGQTLHKIGRTSGWTMGPVNATCVNVNLSPNITLFCQHRVTNLRQGGDSGSPYFRRIGETSDVALAGVHWGGSGFDAVLSPVENIRLENPGPVPWITFPGQTPPE